MRAITSVSRGSWLPQGMEGETGYMERAIFGEMLGGKKFTGSQLSSTSLSVNCSAFRSDPSTYAPSMYNSFLEQHARLYRLLDARAPNPTVTQVIFQIRFPALFSIENKIGDIQERIFSRFPESKLVFSRQFMFADISPNSSLSQIPKSDGIGRKFWSFESPNKYQLNILHNSLDITSNYHKTYNNRARALSKLQKRILQELPYYQG